METPAIRMEPATLPATDFERTFRENYTSVYRAAYRVTGSAEDAEDVLQTVFMRVLKRDPEREPVENMASFLHRSRNPLKWERGIPNVLPDFRTLRAEEVKLLPVGHDGLDVVRVCLLRSVHRFRFGGSAAGRSAGQAGLAPWRENGGGGLLLRSDSAAVAICTHGWRQCFQRGI